MPAGESRISVPRDAAHKGSPPVGATHCWATVSQSGGIELEGRPVPARRREHDCDRSTRDQFNGLDRPTFRSGPAPAIGRRYRAPGAVGGRLEEINEIVVAELVFEKQSCRRDHTATYLQGTAADGRSTRRAGLSRPVDNGHVEEPWVTNVHR